MPSHADHSLFPAGFLWGAASSSFQIEGAASPDLRGESVWDAFCRKPGAVHGGHTGETACDHFHRFEEDVRIMQAMGLKAYRFSIAWPRVIPEGTGAINDRGLAFYDRLVDCLLAHGIQPWVTLFHWDYPLELFRRGGWLNRDSAQWFAEYSRVVVRRLSDRVGHWMTINEPQVFLQLGHADGTHAPGLKLPLREQLVAAHNVLRAHGLATRVIRDESSQPASIGWAPVGHVQFPATDDAASIEAARAATFSITKRDLWNNTWFADPVCLGRYPEDGLRLYGADVPRFSDADMATIHQPIDFYGVNIYTGTPVQVADGGVAPVTPKVGAARTAFNWTVEPDALRWGPKFLADRYKLPVYITENGMSSHDWVDLDGRVLDTARIDYTRRYLRALKRAIDDRADIRGYFHWSILDNFEWAEGYKDRFGLVFVDFATQARTPKLSAHWYSSVVASNGRSLEHPIGLDLDSPLTRDFGLQPKPLRVSRPLAGGNGHHTIKGTNGAMRNPDGA